VRSLLRIFADHNLAKDRHKTVEQVERADTVQRRIQQHSGHMLLDAVDPLLPVLEGPQRLDVLLVIGLRVAAQRSPRGHCLAALLRRCVPPGFALGALRIDRIDAAPQLIARLIRKLARTGQARARRFDVVAVDCTQAKLTTFAARDSVPQDPRCGLLLDAKDQSFAIVGVALARDLHLPRGQHVLRHVDSFPPAFPPKIVASGCIAGISLARIGLYERPICPASSSA